jgi:long-chain acyl-CoA synthetase
MYRQPGDDSWHAVSWQVVLDRVDRLAARFLLLGLEPGDRVAIMLPTCPEWEYCQQAVLAAGGVVVGMDNHDAGPNLRHILDLTQPRAVITQTVASLDTVAALWRRPAFAIVAEGEGAHDADVHSLAGLLDAATAVAHPRPVHDPTPDDPATIVFTSGSTGKPKGIAYSHRQISLACDALLERFPSVREDARMVCWLPLSNLFQRILNLFAMSCGATSYFIARPEDVVRLVPHVRPTLFIGVPRFFEKLHAGIVAELDRQPRAIRTVARAAWDIGCRHATAARVGAPPRFWVRALGPLADKVLRRMRLLMGPDLQFMVSGSAPLPGWLMERFHGLGWLVLEAYGISESVVPIAVNQLDDYRFGSVGRPLPCNEVRLADDRELLVRGPGVFRGYYGDAAPTEALDAEGFLHTGDYARIDADGYLWLEGRKSEVFKTSTGRRIAPAPLETELKRLDYVDHAVILGRDRPFPIALLTIAAQHPFAADLAADATRSALAADASAACRQFPGYQQPGALIVSARPLTVAGGELTANLKIRRKAIEDRFSAQIEEAYRHAGRPPRGQPRSALPVIEAP